MNVVTIQLAVDDSATKAERIERVDGILSEIAQEKRKPDVVILPELWGCGFFDFDHYADSAESIKGETFQMLSKWAKALGCYILGGSIVERDGKDLYNSSLFLDRDGSLKTSYRKKHLFGYQSKEQQLLSKGKETVVVDTEFGKIGFSTCYDLRFCEQYRDMVDKGTEIFLVASAWPEARLMHWRLFNQVRALENQCWLISCNCAGTQKGNCYAGHSMAVSPWGEILSEAGQNGCVKWIDIDCEEVDQARKSFPALADR